MRRSPVEPPKPGFNLFSKEQDIQLGQAAAAQVKKRYQAVGNPWLQDYIGRIGIRLASQPESRASGFRFDFSLLNSRDINAFALPGGPVFVFSQLVLFCDNETQLAGVLAHEISHVILRHGTNQLSKQNLLQLPAALAGAVIGDSTLGQLVEAGLGAGLNGLFLHYSRQDESQADNLGARIMAQAGYNPMEMARFFEKLEQKGGPGVPQFLSDHPSPGNRAAAVEAVVRTLPPRPYTSGSGKFPRAQQLVRELPPPAPKKQP
jgi:predicted Zn-dependent protease